MTNSEHRHSGSDSHFGGYFIGDDTAGDDASAADHERDKEQSPAEIIIWEYISVEQISIVRETNASCKN